MITFWAWLLKSDHDGHRGIENIFNRWLVLHLAVGLTAAVILPATSAAFAEKSVLPAASILVGFSFAWAGRSASLFQDKTFSKFLIENAPPIENYIYSFQLAILVCIAFVVFAFVLLGGGIGLDTGVVNLNEMLNKIGLFSLGSLALRECWGVIAFVNALTVQFYDVRKAELLAETEN